MRALGLHRAERLSVVRTDQHRAKRLGGSGVSSLESLPSPTRNSTAETVESAIARHNAISAAPKRLLLVHSGRLPKVV